VYWICVETQGSSERKTPSPLHRGPVVENTSYQVSNLDVLFNRQIGKKNTHLYISFHFKVKIVFKIPKNSDFKAFEKQVLTALAEIKTDVRELVMRSSSSRPAVESSVKSIPFEFPIKSSETLAELNEWATSNDNFHILVSCVYEICILQCISEWFTLYGFYLGRLLGWHWWFRRWKNIKKHPSSAYLC